MIMVVSPLMAEKIRQESEKSNCKEDCAVLRIDDLNKLVEQINSNEEPIKVD